MLAKVLKGLFINFLLPIFFFFFLLIFTNEYISTFFVFLYIIYTFYRNRPKIYASLGNYSYMKGDMVKAIEWFKKAYLTGRARPKTIVSYAYLLLKTGNIEEPERLLNEVLNKKQEPEDEMLAKTNLSLVYWKKDQLDDAIVMLERVFKNYKTSTIYGSLGYLLILKGDLDKALAFNLEAYEYNDSNTVILDNLGQTYYLRGELDKAEEIFVKLMAAKPTSPGAYYNYSLVLDDLGQPVKALEVLEKALNYKVTFLSAVTQEEIDTKMKELREKIDK